MPAPVIDSGKPDSVGIYVARPDLPVYLEGTQLKYRKSDGELKSLSAARWAESLEDGLARALTEHLVAHSSDIAVSGYYPWPYLSRETPKLHIQAHQLIAYDEGGVQMEVHWHLTKSGDRIASGQFSSADLEWRMGNAASLVAATNEAIRQLSAAIASEL